MIGKLLLEVQKAELTRDTDTFGKMVNSIFYFSNINYFVFII